MTSDDPFLESDEIDLKDCAKLLNECVKHLESIAADTGGYLAPSSVGRLKAQVETTLRVLTRSLDKRLECGER